MVDVVVHKKSNEYEYEKKHARRDSKMCCCCCCCRFCCGAPTTDERINAPVLHDASQILHTAGIEVAPHYHQLLVKIREMLLYKRGCFGCGAISCFLRSDKHDRRCVSVRVPCDFNLMKKTFPNVLVANKKGAAEGAS